MGLSLEQKARSSYNVLSQYIEHLPDELLNHLGFLVWVEQQDRRFNQTENKDDSERPVD